MSTQAGPGAGAAYQAIQEYMRQRPGTVLRQMTGDSRLYLAARIADAVIKAVQPAPAIQVTDEMVDAFQRELVSPSRGMMTSAEHVRDGLVAALGHPVTEAMVRTYTAEWQVTPGGAGREPIRAGLVAALAAVPTRPVSTQVTEEMVQAYMEAYLTVGRDAAYVEKVRAGLTAALAIVPSQPNGLRQDLMELVQELEKHGGFGVPWLPGKLREILADNPTGGAPDSALVPLADMLQENLDQLRKDVIREQSIRDVMAETGEPREVIVEAIEASESMGQEMVTDLMDGEPTTLRVALERYAQRMSVGSDDDVISGDVASAVQAILDFPYPGDQDTGWSPLETPEFTIRRLSGELRRIAQALTDLGIQPVDGGATEGWVADTVLRELDARRTPSAIQDVLSGNAVALVASLVRKYGERPAGESEVRRLVVTEEDLVAINGGDLKVISDPVSGALGVSYRDGAVDPDPSVCRPEAGYHATPHQGCILR